MYSVGLKDYDGFSGFGFSTVEEQQNLAKALSAGYQTPPYAGGSALRVESLEATMRVVTFTEEHLKITKKLTKQPAYSTVEEFTRLTSYGRRSGGFTREGELGQSQDSSFERLTGLIKFLCTQREVTHPMMLVKPAHGEAVAIETKNAALWLLELLERAVFFGYSNMVAEEFDGILTQMLSDNGAAANNVIDLRGTAITQDTVEDAAQVIVDNFGRPSTLYLANKAITDYSKQLYPKERFNYPFPANGVAGLAITAQSTNAGIVEFSPNIFLRSQSVDGTRGAPITATSPRAPTAPTVAGAAAAGISSQFVTADIGTYQYKVTAENRFGETAFAQESGGVAVAAAGDGVDLTITDGGGTETATAYRVYRSRVGGAVGTEEFISRVKRIGASATTVFRDTNAFLPGTSTAFMLQENVENIALKQLLPMMKMALAQVAISVRWAQLIYAALFLYTPRKNFIIRNVLDNPA